MLKLTKQEMMEAIATIYGRLSQGASEEAVIAEMGISADDFGRLKAAMFDHKADEVRTRPIEHIYVDYVIKQTENVRDLTAMIAEFSCTKQYNAMVGAVRARSEIYDKMISIGQSCGLIKKAAERREIMAGVIVADLTNQQLKKAITKELGDLNVLMKRYGDKDMSAVEVGVLHHGERLLPDKPEHAVPKDDRADGIPAILVSALPTFKPKYDSTKNSARSKRVAGRKVVKR
jgi:hypothetical protein